MGWSLGADGSFGLFAFHSLTCGWRQGVLCLKPAIQYTVFEQVRSRRERECVCADFHMPPVLTPQHPHTTHLYTHIRTTTSAAKGHPGGADAAAGRRARQGPHRPAGAATMCSCCCWWYSCYSVVDPTHPSHLSSSLDLTHCMLGSSLLTPDPTPGLPAGGAVAGRRHRGALPLDPRAQAAHGPAEAAAGGGAAASGACIGLWGV